jgi:homoserine O-acetyltransferase
LSEPQQELFASSDSVRSSQPLKYAQKVTFDGPFDLELGGRLPGLTVAYETYGRLSPQRDNAVLVCHALSGDSHVASHGADDSPGWWELAIGSGKAIDTDRYFVICPNALGGCRGTTGPNSINPETGHPYGVDFPTITVGDIARVKRMLVGHLGIEKLRAVVGGSLGGHMALEYATRFADAVRGTVALATSPRLTSQALAFDVVGRNAILRDPGYQAGQYYGSAGPSVGLALARMLGHITYLSREAMTQKFEARRMEPQTIRTQFETKFSVGSYLAHQGDKFVERFDANSYLLLTMAMDLFDLGHTPEQLRARLSQSQCRWLVASFTSDWLFPPFQSQEIVDALVAAGKPVSYCNIESACGHDAFLLANELHLYGGMMKAFLANLDGDPPPADAADQSAPSAEADRNSIFRRHRLDYDSMVKLVPPGASVLDLGCGTGGLLARLRTNGHHRVSGVELDEESILACVRRGLDVVQADLNHGLTGFPDGQFDCVILSQTLQAVFDVRRVLSEMLRVGRQGIVSFPNLGYHKLRAELAQHGRSPHVGTSAGFHWYDTPDLRFFSIADFEEFCRDNGIRILQRMALETAADRVVTDDPNLNADVAIFAICR